MHKPIVTHFALVAHLAVVAALAWCVPAHADPKADARGHQAAADKQFKLGRFPEALDEYTKAYELFSAPPLLFNLGQCHRNLKHWERAVFFLQGYLRERPDAKNRSVVEDLIRESQSELDNERAEQARLQAEAAAKQAAEEAAGRTAAEEAMQLKLAEERRKAEEAQRLRLEEQGRLEQQRLVEQQRAEAERARRAADEREQNRFYRKWWVWSAVGGALAVGSTAYYFSGSTTVVPPTGTLGGLDRR